MEALGDVETKGGVSVTVIADTVLDRMVYPIRVKNRGESYLTFTYYTERGEAVLCDGGHHILYFSAACDMADFCEKHGLLMETGVVEYDFDSPILNPVDYDRVLSNWNFLNTVGYGFRMYFEGDLKKYNSLYDLLFRLNTPAESIPPTYRLSDKDFAKVLKVFRKKDRFLRVFRLYDGE